MSLSAGMRLGPYEILSALGAGGMGEVYKARDTKLGRDVALKTLPATFKSDAGRLARFHREAQMLAALNHSHIGAIYGLDEADGQQFLVLELIDGETLADRIARGPMPVHEAIATATQIADALEAAHEKGIIHRDLKPANVGLSKVGDVKVLDFGLAKAIEPTGDASIDLANSPTLTSPAMMTDAGVILGTAAYMSPEQAKGQAPDKRTDVWAFGCLLFEMLSGKPTFEAGHSVAEAIAATLAKEPDWAAIPAGTPRQIRTLMRRCLQKDPRRRLRDIGDARIELEEAGTEPEASAAHVTGRGARLAWTLAAAAGFAAAALAIRMFATAPPAQPEMRVQIVTPSTSNDFALSPDGRQIVFVAATNGPPRLWLRRLDKGDGQPIAGTDGAAYPFWSADSRAIGFFASNKLYRLDINGGQPQVLANVADGRGGAWNADGTIVFARIGLGPLWRISASGGEPTVVTALDPPHQTAHLFPQFLPDGHHFLFYARGTPEASGIYLGSLDGGQPKRLTAADRSGVYMNPGWLLFVQQGTLVARRLEVSRGDLAGDPVTVADRVMGLSASVDGLVAYTAGQAGQRHLTWIDRTGKSSTSGAPDANTGGGPDLSPDDRRVAIDRTVQNNRDIWVSDLVRGSFTRFTVDPGIDQFPLWSPDGTRIAFSSNRKGTLNLYLKPTSGASAEELLLETPNPKGPQDWSKDGRFLLYVEVDPKTSSDLWTLEVTGSEHTRRAVANSPFDERNAQFSPDGRWVAYQTNESGQFQIAVQAFPVAGGKWQVSTGGGSQPRWRADGKELYFIAPDGKMMAAAVAASVSTFDAEAPVALFPTQITGGGAANFQKPAYAVARDGRFLVSVEEAPTAPITLLLNWKPPSTR